jgi:hypothetical protein
MNGLISSTGNMKHTPNPLFISIGLYIILYSIVLKRVYLFIYLLNKFIFIKSKDPRLRSSSGNNVPFMRQEVKT